MTESSAKTIFDYDRHPTSVYTNSTARLSISVNNRTGEKKDCEFIAFTVPKNLTSDPGSISPSVSDQDKDRWTMLRDEGATNQFNATPIPPVTGLDKGEGVLFILNGVQVSDKTGTAMIGISEMTDEMRAGGVSLIKERPEVTIEFKSDNANIVPGKESTLTWKVEGAAHRTLSWLDKTEQVDPGGSKPVKPLDTTTYTLTAYGLRDIAVSQTTVNVVRVKILDFSVPADPIPMGSKAELRWQTQLANRCELQENGVSINKQAPPDTHLNPFIVTPTVSPTHYRLIAYHSDTDFTEQTKTVLLQSVPRLLLKQKWEAPGSFPLLAAPPAPRSDHRLFANTNGKEVRIFDMSNLSEIGRLPGENVRVWGVSPDGKKLAACKFDNPFDKNNRSFDSSTVMIIDITQGRGYKTLAQIRFGDSGHLFNSEGVFFNSAGNRFYVHAGMWGYEKFTFIFDVNDDGAHDVISFKNRNCEMGALSPDGNKICHPGTDKISIRDLTKAYSDQYEDIVVGSKGRLTQAVWSRDGSKIYLSEIETAENGSKNRIWIVDPTKQKKHQTIDMKPDFLIKQMILGPPMPDVLLASDMLYVICHKKAPVKPEEPGRLVIAISTTTEKQVDELWLNKGEALPANSPDAGAVSADGKTIYLPDKNHICLIETVSTPPSAQLSEPESSPADSKAELGKAPDSDRE